jgi:hypothetical protein
MTHPDAQIRKNAQSTVPYDVIIIAKDQTHFIKNILYDGDIVLRADIKQRCHATQTIGLCVCVCTTPQNRTDGLMN